MKESELIGTFTTPLLFSSIVEKIRKIPNAHVKDIAVKDLNNFENWIDFEVEEHQFTIERDFDTCRIFLNTVNCPIGIIELLRKILKISN